MKYHLGCGSHYLQGYLNVDFPPSEHKVNHNIRVDLYSNLLEMKYEPCDEIRCHHVFEHFSYVDAFFLLRQWTLAMNIGGLLWVDVPDVQALAKALGTPGLWEKDFRIMRYLYGSHEAKWAYHINGWTPRMLSHVMEAIGYTPQSPECYGDPESAFPNCGVHVKARLTEKLGVTVIDAKLKQMLSLYKNGDTEFEQSLHALFCIEYERRTQPLV